VRLSAGREAMSDELQALCFLAGANSIFYGEKLLTTGNPDVAADVSLFARLGLKPEALKGTAAGAEVEVPVAPRGAAAHTATATR
jgi:biotin synthase